MIGIDLLPSCCVIFIHANEQRHTLYALADHMECLHQYCHTSSEARLCLVFAPNLVLWSFPSCSFMVSRWDLVCSSQPLLPLEELFEHQEITLAILKP